MPVNKTVSTAGRVVLCKFWINAVVNFLSPSAQEMEMPTAASEPFLTQIISSPITQVVVLLVYIVNILLTYNNQFEQECDSVAESQTFRVEWGMESRMKWQNF